METQGPVWTEVRALLLGDYNTSKQHFFENSTPDYLLLSLRAGYTVKSFEIDDQRVDLHLWNVREGKNERSHTTDFNELGAIILFYNVNKRSSFETIVKKTEEITSKPKRNWFCIIVGAKHAHGEGREVSTEEGIKFAEDHNMGFFEIPMDDTNIDNAYDFIVKNALDWRLSENN